MSTAHVDVRMERCRVVYSVSTAGYVHGGG